MADMAASVLARLKNKAAATGRSHQLCMQLFCQEEFLRRLEKSKYSENFVLKGGLFVYAVTDFDSRVTVDVDSLLRKIPNTPEQVKAVLEEIIAVPTENDFVTFEIKSVGPIAEVYTHDTKQKKRLLAYAAQFPELCQQTDDDEQGGLRFEIDKSRISIRLTAPYSEERRNVASKLAMETNIFIN